MFLRSYSGFLALLFICLISLQGCQTKSLKVSDFSQARKIKRNDHQPVSYVPIKKNETADTEPAADTASTPLPVKAGAKAYPMDAMVGQINGQAVYASEVLSSIAPLLKGMGQRFKEDEFKENAIILINQEIQKKIFDTLLLAEAERALTVRENGMIQFQLEKLREDLIRRHGRGSEVVADRMLKETTDRDLKQTLADYRKGFVINNQLRNKIEPRINITKRDVEKYFNSDEGRKTFNPPSEITLGMIQVQDDTEADRINKQLLAGVPFKKVSEDEANKRRHGSTMKAMDSNAFAVQTLNDAIAKLKEGEHAGPIVISAESHPELQSPVFLGTWWIMMIQQAKPPQKLEDVQLLIERQLYAIRKRELENNYTKSLLKEGTFTDPAAMAKSLVDVATVLYARSDAQEIGERLNEIIIRSTPPGAIVYVGGERKGPTPQVLWLDNGVHEIELRKQGFQTHKQSIKLQDRKQLTALSPVLKPKAE